ncbi:type 1 glutamine amidotransferase domain-containing protein [Sinorhizobium meliloti]|uniref:type 1 glutamine amidotransferase domain-containing protein n=1 Tax=Rhizobium meliloti TaxID=382 RepID=UPI000FD73934|nr:type 1 glutamine amidotransferase domain-containing protein [Sinorhizobium meliloti]RVE91072.1 type 1 glutamine amidotransferase domain-containing protein [Sinorhizobium meliloti]RVH34157.1 type 1 glutamine amidotransferase domain-containing protein [Sinorhizobium meliloti]
MSNRVLVVVSQCGFWVEELLKPLEQLQSAGYEVQFATPSKANGTPYPDPASFDVAYKDPPLGREVTFEKDLETQARRFGKQLIKADDGKIDWAKTFEDVWEPLFRHRVNLDDQDGNWFSPRPYLSSGNYLDALEEYYRDRDTAWENIDQFAGLLLVGGSGPMFDMVGNGALHNLILGFYYADKPIAAECYAVTCLAMARELDDRKSKLAGRHVTGHTIEYDYTSGWAAYMEKMWVPFTGGAPFVLEYILRDAVQPNGTFHGNVGKELSVIVDYPFITSRSVGESQLCGKLFVEALDAEKRGERFYRYGWGDGPQKLVGQKRR